MNQTKKLPDVYRRDTGSNNYKLMQLCNLLNTDFTADMNSIFNSRDINNAKGKTLDRYGEMVGQSRNGATDEQYRFLILYKMSRLTADCDCDSIIRSLSQMFNADQGDISISENSSGVQINGISIDMANNTGYTMSEVSEMVSGLLPAGVSANRTVFSGTLLITNTIAVNPTEIKEKYPVLKAAWFYAQKLYKQDGKNVGLSGYGRVPEIFGDGDTSGTFDGGTLSEIIS